MNRSRARSLILALALASGAAAARDDGYTIQPYIDAVKERLPPEEVAPRTEENVQPYIDSVKKDLPAGKQGAWEGYTESLKRKLLEGEQERSGSYIESQKAKLGGAKQESAIGKFYEGKSQLKMKRNVEDIHHAAGFRLGTVFSLNIKGSGSTTTGMDFTEIYGDGWNPDFTLFYEYQPFHSEIFGNFGIMASIGASHFKGTGVFQDPPPKAWDPGEDFSSKSRTQFTFISVPVFVGLNYRMNLFRYFRPYVAAGPTLIGYVESRNDGKDSHRGNTKALYLAGGVAILLDWISHDSTWSLYEIYGIKHTYLTVDYVKLTTLSGDVNFDQSGVFAGVTFEF